MTKKDRFVSLLKVAGSMSTPKAVRQASLDDAVALKKEMRVSFEKLGTSADTITVLQESINTATQKPASKTNRGAITAFVTDLLINTDASYATIVDDVKLSYPDAKTTTRSVASVAAALRRKGEKVAKRSTSAK